MKSGKAGKRLVAGGRALRGQPRQTGPDAAPPRAPPALRLFLAGLCLISAVASATASPSATTATASLHVPSPDWRDQVIYFLMTDRFDDGDPGNDDQGTGEFAAADPVRYNGGDLRGVERRLDYIQGLGATAVWITPPVSNRWWDPVANHGGYHGYWADDFLHVDRHLGTLADYQRLSRKVHGAGMYLVQDIVLNHTASYFDYEGGWDPNDPTAHFRLVPDARGKSAPSQSPFDLNDPRRAKDRAAGIYHWTPRVSDFRDPEQVANFQMGGLDDLNSDSPRVREALRRSYDYWIREVGVDAFRVDTALYVPPAAIADLLYSKDAKAPGVLAVARATGRTDFHVFGEGFAIDKPFEDLQARRIETWVRQPDGSPVMPAMINFPLYGSIGDVFARGRPTAEMGYRIASMMRVHEAPALMPTFIDNHDVDRFLSGGSQAGLRQALLLMMTLPGIPTIYYGTEQAFTVPRAAMFKAGSDSGGIDHFDTGAPLYRYIRSATALRREHRLFSRGRPTVLRDNPAGAGALAYRMSQGDEAAIVVFNTADSDVLLDNLETGLEAGVVLTGIFDIGGQAHDLVTGEAGRISLRLPARSGRVWRVSGQRAAVAPTPVAIAFDASGEIAANDDFLVGGSARGLREFKLVVDGELDAAQTVVVDKHGRWSARVDTSRMVDPKIRHDLVAWSEQPAIVSASRGFTVSRQWTTLYEADDPVGDDTGPAHRYVYPLDAGWGAHRQLDIEHVAIAGAGGSMKLSLRMHSITAPWNPPNGFDHVAFTIFVQVPGKAPTTAVMPFQNARLPGEMQWNYRLRAHGWSNALYTAAGASAGSDGASTAPAPAIEVDAAGNSISFVFPAGAFGGIASLSGVKVYVSTWDYDGGFRPLGATAGGSSFGGGDFASDPLVMDDTAVITLP